MAYMEYAVETNKSHNLKSQHSKKCSMYKITTMNDHGSSLLLLETRIQFQSTAHVSTQSLHMLHIWFNQFSLRHLKPTRIEVDDDSKI